VCRLRNPKKVNSPQNKHVGALLTLVDGEDIGSDCSKALDGVHGLGKRDLDASIEDCAAPNYLPDVPRLSSWPNRSLSDLGQKACDPSSRLSRPGYSDLRPTMRCSYGNLQKLHQIWLEGLRETGRWTKRVFKARWEIDVFMVLTQDPQG
jgi:hypothetical protein